jgi:flagellar protein FliS
MWISRQRFHTASLMFTSAHSSSFGRAGGLANAYRQVGVETSVDSASPHRLIALLFDGYMESLAAARGAMRQGQVEAKGKAIGRAARIVDEGLKAALNLRDGGQLAEDLRSLYEYLALRLTQANIRNDESILDECVSLVEPLRAAWKEIEGRVPARTN